MIRSGLAIKYFLPVLFYRLATLSITISVNEMGLLKTIEQRRKNDTALTDIHAERLSI